MSSFRPGRRFPIIRPAAVRALVCAALLATSTAVAHSSPAAPAVPPAPAAPGVPPTRLAIFNSPVANYAVAVQRGNLANTSVTVPGAPSEITAAIVSLLESATARATVTIAMYNSNGTDATDAAGDAGLVRRALRQAAGRVHAVNVLVDGRRGGSAFWKPLASLPRVTVRQCAGSCFHGGRAVMHNKFLLVDDTKWTPGAEHVVLQLTANLTDAQLSSAYWNSAVQVWGNAPLYDAYLAYHKQLFDCAPRCTGAPTPQNFTRAAWSGLQLSVFPRASNTDDPVLQELLALSGCDRSGGVDVAVNDWRQDLRGLAILDRLEQLAQHGCRVRLVVPEGVEGKRIGALLPHTPLAATAHCASFEAAERTRDDSRHMPPSQRDLVPRVHSKYILMRGTFRGAADTMVVSTGSERFTGGSRDLADETWLTLTGRPHDHVANAATYAQFKANFEQMYAVTPRCADSPAPTDPR